MAEHGMDAFLSAEADRPVPWWAKGAGSALAGVSATGVRRSPVPLGDLPTPVATLDGPALAANIHAMQDWCDRHGVLLAPHGKTTMAPALWRRQLDAGAWGITVATESQLRVAVGGGVPRVHLAGTPLGSAGLAWLGRRLTENPSLVVHSWVDSARAVEIMDEALPDGAVLPVLVEVGVTGGRTGTRSLREFREVAEAVTRARRLALVGVSGYEGAVTGVEEFLDQMAQAHDLVTDLYEADTVFLSAGGSVHFDRVAAVLGAAARESARHTRVLIRSGAYIAHDDGFYRRETPSVRGEGPVFRPAMHVWARVVSVPEPGYVLLDAGRRDLPFDQGLPVPQQHRRVSRAHGVDALTAPVPLEGEITALNDQHAYLRCAADAGVRVGDVVRLGISHPCTAFDKWAVIPVIDDCDAPHPSVHDLVHTYF